MLQQIFYLVIVSPLFVSALYIIFKEESFLLLLNRSKNSKVKERFKISKRLYVMSFVALILILDLAKRIIKATNSKSDIKYVDYKDAYGDSFEDMDRRVPNISLIKELTGWEPKRDLDQIINDVVEYQKANLK